jgi:hypothetical protein
MLDYRWNWLNPNFISWENFYLPRRENQSYMKERKVATLDVLAE